MLMMADFECITTAPTRVWGWYMCEIGNLKHNYKGTDIKSFLETIIKIKPEKCYFHNLRYDGSFILDYLLKHKCKVSNDRKLNINDLKPLISVDGSWYSIDWVTGYDKKARHYTVTKFVDSLKLLNMSVRKIAKSFELPFSKGDCDYFKERPIGYEPTDEEWDYIKRDVEIVALALEEMFANNCDSLTIGSCALKNFTENIGIDKFAQYFPQLPPEEDSFIRKAYKGGFTWLNPIYENKEVKSGVVYDCNSMHPSAMHDKPMPVGRPHLFFGEPPKKKLWVAQYHVDSCELKDKHIPCIQIKNNWRYIETEYLKEIHDDDIYITNIDYELIKENYEIEGEFVFGYSFESKVGIFSDYIDSWMKVKATTTGGKRQIAKLMLNTLYGKFGTRPERVSKEPIIDGNRVRLVTGPKEMCKSVYIPVACFVTAYSRDNIIRNALKEYDRFIYCDTDSLHLEGTEIPKGIDIHPTRLGAYKLENTFTKAKFIRAKTYIEVINGENQVKCCGLSNESRANIDYDEFRIGYTNETGKKKPKLVEGGTILVDESFQIKPQKNSKK